MNFFLMQLLVFDFVTPLADEIPVGAFGHAWWYHVFVFKLYLAPAPSGDRMIEFDK